MIMLVSFCHRNVTLIFLSPRRTLLGSSLSAMQSLTFRRRDAVQIVATQQRLSFGKPSEDFSMSRRYRAAWISDAHLGTSGCNATALLAFLRETDFDTLYIVGDLIDLWSLRRAIYWPQQHNDVVQKILRK